MTTIDFLRGVSDWFNNREAGDGSTVCPRHKIEHTGKTVYSASIDRVLLQSTGDDRYRDRIRRRVLRTLSMVREDPSTGNTVFFPGSLDHRNAATNLIDSGACCDVLSEVITELPDLFDADERSRIQEAVEKVCRTYLMQAVLVKEVPAQKLWGATGLARAAQLLDRPLFGDRAREAVRLSIEQAHSDGSIPYMPDPEKHGEHVGLSDVTVYYHSRHLGFISYIYRVLDEEMEDSVRDFMRRGLDFLCALYGRDGIKPLCNEAKQWYWESEYEVASHSFDVHALVEGYLRFEDPRYALYSRLSLERLLEHVDTADGGVQSHHGEQINFQCRDFWNGHVAWVARIHESLSASISAPETVSPAGMRVFEDAGIIHVEREDYVAMLRGKKQPINISFGGEAGGGSLIYFGRRENGFEDAVKIKKWTSRTPGSFVVTPKERPPFRQRVAEFYRDNRHDMRFRLYVANIERKAGNTRMALGYPFRHVVSKLRDEVKGRYASHFDISPSISMGDQQVTFSSMLARRDGSVLAGSSQTRRYHFGESDIEVEEVLKLDLPVRAVLYERIPSARDFQVVSDVPYREGDSTVFFQPEDYPATITVRFRL